MSTPKDIKADKGHQSHLSLQRLQKVVKRPPTDTQLYKMSVSQIKVDYSLGASLCQCIEGRPYPFSVDSSVPSPSPRCSVSPAFVLESFTEGEEWMDTEVIASLECSGKPSVSFAGSTLTGRDRSVLGTPLVNVSVISMLFVWVTDGFWRAVKLLLFFILPEAKTEEEHASEWLRKIRILSRYK